MVEILRHHLRNVYRFMEGTQTDNPKEIAERFVDSLHPSYREPFQGLGRESYVSAIEESVKHIQRREPFKVIRDNTVKRDGICDACSKNLVTGNHLCKAVISKTLYPAVETEEWPYFRSRDSGHIVK